MRDIIERYPITPPDDGNIVITLPKGSKFLDVQFGLVEHVLSPAEMLPCFWFETDSDPTVPMVKRYFLVVGTGQKKPDLESLTFLKTVQYAYPGAQRRTINTLVFHFYERQPKCTCAYKQELGLNDHAPFCELAE